MKTLKTVLLSFFFLAFSASQITAGKVFTFALLTDIHISKNNTSVEDLQNSIASINQSSDIEMVFVTGDLTDEGDNASLLKAKGLLDGLKMPYYAVQGNHETKWSESGATGFRAIFGSDNFRVDKNNCTFLGFNTGPIIRMMDGHVGIQDIHWMEKELKKTPTDNHIFILTHYPLLNGDVDNWYEVTDLLRKYNVKAVLGGHYHRNKLTDYDGIPAVINRSNLRAKEAVGGYSIYEITPDSILVYEQIIGQEKRKWGGYALHHAYYEEDNSNYPRPDYSINKTYSELTETWRVRHNAAIYSSPIMADNKVFVGDDRGMLSCFALEDGRLLWQFAAGESIIGTPAVYKNVVVFGSGDHYIYGIHAVNGDLLWKVKTDAAVLGAVTIQGNRAYIGGSDGVFRCLNIKTGKLIWEYEGVGAYVETKPLIYKQYVMFGAWDTNMYALNKNTGKLRWTWNNGHPRMHYSPAAVWPVAAHGKVFFTAPDRVITALKASNGKEVWRTKESMVRETIGLSADKKRIYSKTMQDSVVCYSATSKEPQKIWSVNVAYGYDHAPSMPVEKDKVVYGSTKNGIIFALDALSGKLIWKYKIGNSLINTVLPIGNSKILITSAEGWVVLLDDATFQDKSF